MVENENQLKEQDVFDKFMDLSFLRTFKLFYIKHKEALSYLFFGGIAFLLNFGLFAGIDYFLHINELINNMICWIICVLFQFFTNRIWVFDGHVNGMSAFSRQLLNFTGGRVITLTLEEIILAICITWLGWNTIAVKLVAQIIVIILNYVISKVWVFKK